MRYLILFDRKFPYKSGEAFLENEIDEIANKFDRVIIYPSDAERKSKMTRSIKADNVEVRVLSDISYKLRVLGYIAKGVFRGFKSQQHGFKRKMVDGYFLAAVDSQLKDIRADLEKIRFTKEDTVYLYSYWLYITAGVACGVKAYFDEIGVKSTVFSRAHRFDIYEEKRKFGFLPQREELFTKLNKVFACSDNGTDYLKNKYPAFSSKFETAYLGTYDHGTGNAGDDDQNRFRIVSCSRLSEVKRVTLIIDALKLLENSGVDIEWTHIGGGELLEKTREYAAANIAWMKYNFLGTVPNTEVYNYYHNNKVDLFVNVSSSEGLPVSIMEATSFGIPIVATDVGGTNEIVIPGVSGSLLIENFKPVELANEIKRFIKMDNETYMALRNSTREFWLDHYQAPLNYVAFVEAIESL